MSKIKAFLLLVLFGVLCLGAWVLVAVDTALGWIIIAAGFIALVIFSTVCPSPRWF